MIYLAPLTTCGNLPFRRLCKTLGVDVTCSEMTMCNKLLKGASSEWALLKRHPSENFFGIQILTGHVNEVAMTIELLNEYVDCSFIDLNVGCPIDEFVNKRCGSGLLQNNPIRLRQFMRTLSMLSSVPVTCKLRKGYINSKPCAFNMIEKLCLDGVSAIGLHGRSRQQRYRRAADWDYILETSNLKVPLIGNGDIYTFEEYNALLKLTNCDTLMIGRGALIKPWIFTEIKEQRHWDISANERLDLIKRFVNFGLEHWGCDTRGVDTTRRFLLEWLSFTYRYIPVGILEKPVKICSRPPIYVGRNGTETLLSSGHINDWLKISEMFLGPVTKNFRFIPKHKANSYSTSNNLIE